MKVLCFASILVSVGAQTYRRDKPGFCPPMTNDEVGLCVYSCSSDNNCPGKQKCCSNSCGRSCQEPTNLDKPGFCPQDASERPCADICSSDDSCPGNEKCCRYDCGLSCQVPTKVNCETVYRYCPRQSCTNYVRPPGECCSVCSDTRY
ncbi:WAP four-disulfide core domain protein 2-like [Dreissena polymorpha]|uniref:WAP domain-containing protein n=1 Tax=Dreissena polymorpha TaxID=45954 RepID=A0A9D4EJX2_DREPO|nr:WAP four-disulfide core domain protein 2-like [Dreissena polymorpha]KAH3780673.1 hypothetical protein DPMN_158492 [Dreissena polymorpha]